MDLSIKQVLRRIYEFDFSHCEVKHKREFYVAKNGSSEFITAFQKKDIDNGIIVTPGGYTVGLFYSSDNGGEIYSPPKFNPDIVTFNFNFYGLKKGMFYRITIPARSAGSLHTITNDRSLKVITNTQELIIDEDLTDINDNKECYGVFRATSNEATLFFTMGKIYISDIIIDEIELLEEEEDATEEVTEDIFESGKLQLAAYGIYDMFGEVAPGYEGRYIGLQKYSGKGINIYYDRVENEYVVERDNANDILGTSFTAINYIPTINLNKICNDNHFNTYKITEISAGISPNTLRQGFIRFALVDYNGEKVQVSNNYGKIIIMFNRLY